MSQAPKLHIYHHRLGPGRIIALCGMRVPGPRAGAVELCNRCEQEMQRRKRREAAVQRFAALQRRRGK